MHFFMILHEDKGWRAVVCASEERALELFGVGEETKILLALDKPSREDQMVWDAPGIVFVRSDQLRRRWITLAEWDDIERSCPAGTSLAALYKDVLGSRMLRDVHSLLRQLHGAEQITLPLSKVRSAHGLTEDELFDDLEFYRIGILAHAIISETQRQFMSASEKEAYPERDRIGVPILKSFRIKGDEVFMGVNQDCLALLSAHSSEHGIPMF